MEKLQPLVMLSERMAQQQAQPQTPGQASPDMGGWGGLLQMLPQLIQGGGGQDSAYVELGKQALMAQINMSKSITDAVVSKITGKAVAEVATAIVS